MFRYFLALFFLPYFLIGQIQKDMSGFPFTDYQIIIYDTEAIFLQSKNQDPNESLKISLAGMEMTVFPSGILAPEYKCVGTKGQILTTSKDRPIPYSGYTTEGYLVSLTIAKDMLIGTIKLPDDEIIIEPLDFYQKNNFLRHALVIYRDSDIKTGREGTCGMTAKYRKKAHESIERSILLDLCYEVEYAISQDYSMVANLGSVAAAEAYGISITNEMNTVYQDQFADTIRFRVTGQFISDCSTCDPWTSSTDINTVLNDYTSWAQNNLDSPPINIPHDNSTFWTNRDFDGGTIGLAWLGTICGSNKYNVCQHLSSTTLNRRLVSHEVGHNFNAVHDSSNGFVMAPVVNNASDTWSAQSITDIEAKYMSVSCLSTNCLPPELSINWDMDSIAVTEDNGTGSAGMCGMPYTDLSFTIKKSSQTSETINVNISAGPNSEAGINDYEILTPNVTFDGGGTLDKMVSVRIFDDVVEEAIEMLDLQLSVSSGSAIAGPLNTLHISIKDNEDMVSNTCCLPEGPYTYGSGGSSLYSIYLAGNNTQSKSRFLIPASLLTSIGFLAGDIYQLDFYVGQKGSTGPFQNFRVGMLNFSGTALPSNWPSTTTVYQTDLTTTTGWNNMVLDSPFTWDGTSSLYVEFCFVNTSAVGADFLRVEFQSSTKSSFATSYGGQDVCSGTIYGWNNYSILPWFRVYGIGGTMVETTLNATASGQLNAGETGHFFSSSGKIIASVKNLGNTDMDCINVDIFTAGNGAISYAFDSDKYTQKTIHINADNDAPYEVTLYYTQSELNTWGSQNLNVVKSTVPFSTASASDIQVVSPLSVVTGIGADNGIAYKGSFSGFSYFALTNKSAPAKPAAKMNADFVINDLSSGIILTSPNGTKYIVKESTPGVLAAFPYSGQSIGATLQNADLFITDPSKALYFKASSGYSKYNAGPTGNLVYTPTSTIPPVHTRLDNGHLDVTLTSSVILLKSPSGNCLQLSVTDNGVLVQNTVGCN